MKIEFEENKRQLLIIYLIIFILVPDANFESTQTGEIGRFLTKIGEFILLNKINVERPPYSR